MVSYNKFNSLRASITAQRRCHNLNSDLLKIILTSSGAGRDEYREEHYPTEIAAGNGCCGRRCQTGGVLSGNDTSRDRRKLDLIRR